MHYFIGIDHERCSPTCGVRIPIHAFLSPVLVMRALTLMYPFRTLGKTVATTLLVGPKGLPVNGPTTAALGAPERPGRNHLNRQA